MAVVGFTKFERLFRVAGSVDVDRDDVQRYLDFVNDALYDMLIMAQATAKANVRDVIDPWDLPLTKGLQDSMHAFERMDEDIEIEPILEDLAARPPLDVSLDDDTQARLPLDLRWHQRRAGQDVPAHRPRAEAGAHRGMGPRVPALPGAGLT